jgi:hypothetical protein
MTSLELTLRSLKLSTPLAGNGHSLLQARLILPRPGIQGRHALKALELKRGTVSLRRAPFYQAGLLKEKVEGRFGLQVQLTRPQRNPEATRALQALLASVIDAAGDTLAAQIPLSSLRNLARAPFEQLVDQIDDDAPEFILEGGLDCDSETLTSGSITLPLRLTQTLRPQRTPPQPQLRTRRTPSQSQQSTTYKKGLPLGEAVFDIQVDG